MAIERELKFEITDSQISINDLIPSIGIEAEFKKIEFQTNTYFDTKNFVLRQNKCALRIRKIDKYSIITLKRLLSLQFGQMKSEEIEVEVNNIDVKLKDIPNFAPEIWNTILFLVKKESLSTVSFLKNHRELFKLRNIGELSLDRVQVFASNEQNTPCLARFNELEIEFLQQINSEIIDKIDKNLSNLPFLIHSTQTKLARALHIIQQSR